MSGDVNHRRAKNKAAAGVGDLVICLDTGSLGIILRRKAGRIYLVSFPHGAYDYHFYDFDILKSGK